MSIKLVSINALDTTGAKPGSNLIWVAANASFEWVQGTYVPAVIGPNWANTPTESILRASDATTGDYFGTDVSLSANATYALSTAYLKDNAASSLSQAGAGYVYSRSGSTWTEQAILRASDAEAVDRLGFGGDINSDGTYVIIGAYLRSNPLNDAGAAYVYTRSGSTWTQQAKLTASDAQVTDQFGYSVSINGDGDYAVVGARQEDGGAGDPLTNAGAAYVFTRSGSTWTEQAILRASDAQASDYFGLDVALNSNATYAIVGAPFEDGGAGDPLTTAGAAYIFSRTGSTWTQQAKIVSSDLQADDNFGVSVDINSDGTYAVVSSRYEGGPLEGALSGAAYVFKRTGTSWVQQAKLVAEDAQYQDYMGDKVSINSDGTRVVVGAGLEDGGAGNPLSNAGAVYVFSRQGSSWTQQAKLSSSDLQANDRFGNSVAINGDGSYIMVGAYLEDGGSGDPIDSAGAAYIFNAQ